MQVSPRVKARPEQQSPRHKIDIGVGENNDIVPARKFHDGWCVRRRESGQNLAAILGGTGENNFIDAVCDCGASGCRRFRQHL